MDAELTFVSLFSGVGGLDQGFLDAGFSSLLANDIDADACRSYRRNIGDEIVCSDISGIGNLLPSISPDLVIGGPPCQGFSVAGHMRPDDPRSQHVWSFLDVVDDVHPRAFVMENVKNLAVNPRWEGLRDALATRANAMGYETDLWVLDASHYGVPQKRERMFLVGVEGSTPVAPSPVTKEAPPPVREALSKLPAYGRPGNDAFCTAKVTPARRPVLRRSPFAGMLFNGKGRPLDLDAPASTLPASMGGNRTPILDQAQLDGESNESWVVGYHAHLVAGGDPIEEVPLHLRRLTVQEAAAIQTFPSRWKFSGRQSSQFRQIGNAVPPMLASHVAHQLKRLLAGVPAVVARRELSAA